METSGHLRVNGFLQVEGHEDIYAIGDCNNVPDIKSAYRAAEQGKRLAANIVCKYTGKTPTEWKAGETNVYKVVLKLDLL